MSGEYRGKQQIEKLFQRFLLKFPRFSFHTRNVCVKNIFDMIGTNVISVEWLLAGENKENFQFTNCGVTVIEIVRMKVRRVQDFYFDTDWLKKTWGE